MDCSLPSQASSWHDGETLNCVWNQTCQVRGLGACPWTSKHANGVFSGTMDGLGTVTWQAFNDRPCVWDQASRARGGYASRAAVEFGIKLAREVIALGNVYLGDSRRIAVLAPGCHWGEFQTNKRGVQAPAAALWRLIRRGLSGLNPASKVEAQDGGTALRPVIHEVERLFARGPVNRGLLPLWLMPIGRPSPGHIQRHSNALKVSPKLNKRLPGPPAKASSLVATTGRPRRGASALAAPPGSSPRPRLSKPHSAPAKDALLPQLMAHCRSAGLGPSPCTVPALGYERQVESRRLPGYQGAGSERPDDAV